VALAKTNVGVEGARGSRRGVALVDACSSLTPLDAAVAAEVDVKLTGRTIKLMVADGHEIVGGLGMVEKLAVEGEEPPGHVAAAVLPPKLKERLQALGLAEW
jgi:hypothetical protein